MEKSVSFEYDGDVDIDLIQNDNIIMKFHLKNIKEQLIAQVQNQMTDLKCVDTKELGEVIDMIKDLSEAVYYCEIYD